MITTTNANNILKLFFGQSTSMNSTGKCFLGLSTTTPSADGSNFTEPAPSTGYERVQINIKEAQEYTNKMTIPSNGSIENNTEINFPEALGSGYGTVTHFGVFNEKENGIPLYIHTLTSTTPDESGNYPAQPVTVEAGEVLLFRKGALSLAFVQDGE